jgi:hypothetical protein
MCTPEADGENIDSGMLQQWNANPNGIILVTPHINVCCITMVFLKTVSIFIFMSNNFFLFLMKEQNGIEFLKHMARFICNRDIRYHPPNDIRNAKSNCIANKINSFPLFLSRKCTRFIFCKKQKIFSNKIEFKLTNSMHRAHPFGRRFIRRHAMHLNLALCS